jgi:hypothetical protein
MRAILIALTLTLAVLPAPAQTTAPAPLPPEAQAGVDKGVLAAKQQDFVLAIRYFQDARKLAPRAPEIYYDLGLAESRIPGRELRAIAWFGAYLTANPTAVNVAAVNDFISGLQIKNQGNINRLIKTAQDAASQPGNEGHLDDVARLWLETGDLAAALKTADLNHSATDSDTIASNKGRALNNIAEAQAKAGDTAGARKTFEAALQTGELIQETYIKGSLQQDIARAQARAGDIAGAQKSATLINYGAFSGSEGVKSKFQSFIAETQAESGDIAGAKETLAVALKIANSIQDAYEKPDALEEVVKVQAKLGDIPGAKETLAAALKVSSSIGGRQIIGMLNFDIAKAQLKAGDFAGARESLMKYAASNPDPENEYMTKWVIRSFQKEIDDAQAKGGSGNKSADTVSPTIVAQAPIPANKVSDWINKLDDNVAQPAQYSVCPLNTELFLDLAGYFTAQRSDDPHKLFYALKEAAEKIIKAQNVIDKMLNQQAGK